MEPLAHPRLHDSHGVATPKNERKSCDDEPLKQSTFKQVPFDDDLRQEAHLADAPPGAGATHEGKCCECCYRPSPVGILLAGLPSYGDGFLAGARAALPPTRRYVPGESDACERAPPSSPTRMLVRTLRAALPASPAPPVAPILPPPPAPSAPASSAPASVPLRVSRKRTRDDEAPSLEAMPKRERQRCLRIALVASTSTPEPASELLTMRQQWRADARARFRLTHTLRRLLAASANMWRMAELRCYADACGIPSRSRQARTDLVAAVRRHLAPASHSG